MLFIQCEMSPGAFSGEIQFKLQVDEHNSHLGLASPAYFRDAKGDQVKSVSEKTEGFVAARVLDEKDDNVLVSIPDGEVIWVRSQLLSRLPKHVPVRP